MKTETFKLLCYKHYDCVRWTKYCKMCQSNQRNLRFCPLSQKKTDFEKRLWRNFSRQSPAVNSNLTKVISEIRLTQHNDVKPRSDKEERRSKRRLQTEGKMEGKKFPNQTRPMGADKRPLLEVTSYPVVVGFLLLRSRGRNQRQPLLWALTCLRPDGSPGQDEVSNSQTSDSCGHNERKTEPTNHSRPRPVYHYGRISCQCLCG